MIELGREMVMIYEPDFFFSIDFQLFDLVWTVFYPGSSNQQTIYIVIPMIFVGIEVH